jgi:uridine phosphorylase
MTDTQYATLFATAHAAGLRAVEELTLDPMIVRDGTRTYYVADGPCGFAWITIKPGTSKLARAAVRHAGASKAYGGGVQIWVSDFNQSIQRKEAYARAYATVLRTVTGEPRVYAHSRLD